MHPGDLKQAGRDFLSGGGALSSLIREFDWSATPLGPVEAWPQSLKTTVSLMLNSRQPMWVGWGPEASFLYNDAYISVLSQAKHPWALGRPASEVWAEIWDVCGPLADRVFDRGEASFQDDVRLFMRRDGWFEEVFYSFSYSPIRDESGGVGGLFCPSAETTGKVLGTRRLSTLSALAAKALLKGSVAEACATAMATLAENPDDLAFALFFLSPSPGERELRLAGSAGLGAVAEAQRADPALWQGCLGMGANDLREMPVPAVPGLPEGLAGQPVSRMAVLPVSASRGEPPLGVLVAGISPARPLDADYAAFLQLVASQLAATVRNAEAAQATRARAEQLAALDRAKTLFFSNVSHELRTPLTLMLAPMQELLEQAPPGESRQLLGMALRNGRRLHKLVNNLLDFSRIEAGRASATYVPTDLAALTAELASSFRSAVERAGMRLTVDVAPLPGPAWVDREMWEKVVLNLVSNAFKYTLEGGILVRLFPLASEIVLEVADSGSGISDADMPRLFERFHRIEASGGRTHEGTGIGLALVQELVRLHAGQVEVESQPGAGSTFRVRIPAGRAHLAPGQVREAPLQPPAAGFRGAAYVEEALGWLGEAIDPDPVAAPAALPGPRSRVVLADDNADMREYIARLLRGQGHEVETVADGLAALEAVRRQPPDLLVSDVMMPGLDGFGLLQAVREREAAAWVPVILLSARAGEEARIEGLRAGADDYLTKPFSARELLARVDSTLAISRVRREALRVERSLRDEVTNVLESIREGFVALDGEFRFTYVNAEAERLNGVRREALLGRTHWEAYPGSVGTELEQRLRDVVARREPAHFENHYAPWNRWFEVNAYPAREGGGAVLYFRDITESRRAAEAAREADRRKDEFIATLAHELRNPLAPIRTGAQLLRRGVQGEAAVRTHAVMERQLDHMVRLIDDLMDVARISRGKVELRRQRVSLREVVDAALETSRPLLDAGQHQLFTSMPHGDTWLDADPTRMAQVVANLLNNAAKYTPPGGRVMLTASRQGGKLDIVVEDNGSGIPADLLPHVFDMFMQGERTRDRAQGGLGIGLTLVRQLVRMHGGEAVAHSAGAGQGSRFVVTLPVAEQPPTPKDAGPGSGAAAGSGLRILIADDNADAADSLAMLLGMLGHSCVAVNDGPAALAAFERDSADVVLLDIGMPQMDGYEVARRLRALQGGPGARLVALTGWGAAGDRVRSREAGFDFHLTKPVDVPALQQVLAPRH